MEKQKTPLGRFYDWLGVLLAVCLIMFSLTGKILFAPAEEDAAVSAPAATSDGSVIVVDAGHGLPDGGAESPGGVKEAGLNLAVAKLVESGLQDAGFTVIMTRTGKNALDKTKREDMAARRAIMRTDGVSAVVSIHMNKFRDPVVRGPMVFYMKGSAKGEWLAASVIENVCRSIGDPKRNANPGDYYVLRESVAPAVIVECGFLSNPADERLLQDKAHQEKLACGIAAGIAAYFAADR
ncbi:MAG: N-acetylmuramoyl-L-alanine amidase [Clostridiales bacterium]|nr:N-acetylmuramoyl-L-alanine amidase [Clostridiales bacterium]